MFTGEGCTLHSYRSRRRHRSRSTRRHLVRSSSHDGRCRVPDIFHKPHSDPLSYKGRNRKEVAERGVVVMVVLVVVVLVMVVLVVEVEVVVVLEVMGHPH